MHGRGVRNVCVAVVVALAFSPSSFGGIEGDVGLLRRVAEGHRANKEKIHSWRGRATVAFDNHYPPGLPLSDGVEAHRRKDEVVFIYDGGAQATRWNSTTVEESMVRHGATADNPVRQGISNFMVRDGAFYRLTWLDADRQGNILRRILTIEKYEQSTFVKLGVIFHPMYYLTESGRDIHDWLMSHAEGAEGAQVSGTVSRTGDVVTFETRTGETVARYQFDLAKGCNLVNSLEVIGQSTQNLTLEYEEVEGGFLPKRMVRGIMSKGAGGESVSQWEVEFVNQALNAPVDSSEFELEKLGLEPGDWVRDTRSNTGYAFGIEGSAALSGLVVDLDGVPVENCRVLVERSEDRLQVREMTTGPDGAFHFEGLPDTNLALFAFVPPPGGGVITNSDRRIIPSGTKAVRLVLPVKQKAETRKPVSVGEPAPELVLEEGAGVTLAQSKGKPVVLAFVSIYSKPCVKVLDDLKAFQAEKGADKLAVIAVHDRTATPEEIEQFRKEHGITFPIVRVPDAPREGWDGEAFRAYGVTALPTVVRIDAEGKVESVGADVH
jgi:peroxiredoxin